VQVLELFIVQSSPDSPLFLNLRSSWRWKWRQQDPSKRLYLTETLYGVTT